MAGKKLGGIGHLLASMGVDVEAIQKFLEPKFLENLGNDLKAFIDTQKRIEEYLKRLENCCDLIYGGTQAILDIAKSEGEETDPIAKAGLVHLVECPQCKAVPYTGKCYGCGHGLTDEEYSSYLKEHTNVNG